MAQENEPKQDHREPRKPFVQVGFSIMRDGQTVATARSHTYARRIANALNSYKPSASGR